MMQRSPSVASAGFDWDDVRLFLALTRARTVGQAGKALGVDASTVSRRLAALEQALGATLFQRGRDGLQPTEAVLELLPVAEEIEAAMSRFTSTADGFERAPSGRVRITCPPDVAEVALVPLLAELRGLYPALRLEIDPSETLADLTRREADIALRTVRPKTGDLLVLRLRRVRWVLAAAPKLARSLGALRAWAEAPWIGWGEQLESLPPARWLAEHAPLVDPVVRSNSLRLQLAAAAAGAGVSLVPEPSVAHYRLAPVKLARALRASAAAWPTDELFLVTHQSLRKVPRVSAVWEHLANALGENGRRRELPSR